MAPVIKCTQKSPVFFFFFLSLSFGNKNFSASDEEKCQSTLSRLREKKKPVVLLLWSYFLSFCLSTSTYLSTYHSVSRSIWLSLSDIALSIRVDISITRLLRINQPSRSYLPACKKKARRNRKKEGEEALQSVLSCAWGVQICGHLRVHAVYVQRTDTWGMCMRPDREGAHEIEVVHTRRLRSGFPPH